MEHLTNQLATRLTTREAEILQYIARGLSSKQIAASLFISINTVSNHRRNMLRKKHAKSSAELVSANIGTYAK